VRVNVPDTGSEPGVPIATRADLPAVSMYRHGLPLVEGSGSTKRTATSGVSPNTAGCGLIERVDRKLLTSRLDSTSTMKSKELT